VARLLYHKLAAFVLGYKLGGIRLSLSKVCLAAEPLSLKEVGSSKTQLRSRFSLNILFHNRFQGYHIQFT